MSRSKRSEAQIFAALKQAEAGARQTMWIASPVNTSGECSSRVVVK